MTERTPLRPICIVGPPASGKTTLAEHLARAIPAPVFRPRSVVQRTIGKEPAVIGLFPRDRLGFVPDEALGYALRSVLDHLSGPVVLENLPWNVFQLADLYRIAHRGMALIVLKASDDLVERRRAQRRYCKRCYPAPALQTADSSCLRCGDTLTFRSDDEIAMFAERVSLRRVHTVQMVSLAHKLRAPIVELDATIAPSELTQQVLEFVAFATSTAA
jgi:adenylate kinase family enzyme